MDPLKKAIPGDPLTFSATTLNHWGDAARAWRLRKGGNTGGQPLDGDPLAAANLVLVKWTGSDLGAFSVLTPSGAEIEPTSQDLALAARRQPVFTGAAPSAATDAVLITVEPILDGSIGRAAVAGVVPCRVNVSSASHGYAEPDTGTTDYLASAASGPARILWREGGTGEQWAIVLLEGTGASGSESGFFARLTDTSGGAWDFVRLKLSAGAYVDDGIETTGYPAVPLTIDGSYLCNPVADLRVWMIPSQQAGKYEFLPIGYASGTGPGLISLTSQTMGDGPKSFLDQVYVNTTPLAGGVGVDSVRFAVYSNDGSNNTINGFSVSQYGTNSTYVRIGQAFPTYSAITQMVGPVYIGATTGLGGANVDGDLIIYNWGGSYHGLDCQFTYPIGVNGGSASASFTGGVRLYGQGGATSGWGGGSSYSATVDVYPVYDGAYNLLFLNDAGLYADHHIYCERDIRAGHGSTSGHSYYCDGDQGLTEDVAIPGADGNTYTLHFTGGIYIGYDVDPTGT